MEIVPWGLNISNQRLFCKRTIQKPCCEYEVRHRSFRYRYQLKKSCDTEFVLWISNTYSKVICHLRGRRKILLQKPFSRLHLAQGEIPFSDEVWCTENGHSLIVQDQEKIRLICSVKLATYASINFTYYSQPLSNLPPLCSSFARTAILKLSYCYFFTIGLFLLFMVEDKQFFIL